MVLINIKQVTFLKEIYICNFIGFPYCKFDILPWLCNHCMFLMYKKATINITVTCAYMYIFKVNIKLNYSG